ncbi:MAG: hypothetical protein J6J27_02870 [Alphaproteobacteria bacterium]|nr:hypothetical protein [Alphaproteobacteria bacterium]
MNTIKVYCPHCGRCIAIRSTKNDRAITKTLCNKPTTEKENEMIEGLKCIKCKAIVYVSFEIKPA